MAFLIRKLNDEESLGARLKTLRSMANQTIGEMAERTKIQRQYIEAFEANAYADLPEPFYAKKLLTNYVKALGGDISYFVQRYEAECGTCDFVTSARLPRARAKKAHFRVSSRYIKIAALALTFLAITAYLGWNLRLIVIAPELTITSPIDGFTTTEPQITITGLSQDKASVEVNGNSVLLSTDGSFEISIPLERGLNIVNIEAKKRYSRTNSQHRRVIVTEPQ